VSVTDVATAAFVGGVGPGAPAIAEPIHSTVAKAIARPLGPRQAPPAVASATVDSNFMLRTFNLKGRRAPHFCNVAIILQPATIRQRFRDFSLVARSAAVRGASRGARR